MWFALLRRGSGKKQRFEKLGMAHLRINAQADGALARRNRPPDTAGLKLMRDAADAKGLSARGWSPCIGVARTLADLDGREQIARLHIAEALTTARNWRRFRWRPDQPRRRIRFRSWRR
jgi:predicted ATPase with chaperone activity